MAGVDKFYWDSCLFIAWLKDEQDRKPGEMDGVRDYIERLNRREIVIFTSTLTFVEVRETKIGAGGFEMFESVMQRKATQRVSVDTKIAKLAGNLRDYYSERHDEYRGLTLSGPDAIHIATAIINKVSEFHTFDETNRHGSLGLIPLSENVGGYNLKICKPIATQRGLDFRVT